MTNLRYMELALEETSGGRAVPQSLVSKVASSEAPSRIWRERPQRRICEPERQPKGKDNEQKRREIVM